MKTLYLHIGTPKTGTTTIQNFCLDNQKLLAQKGYYYPTFEYQFPHIKKYCNAHFLVAKLQDSDGWRNYDQEQKVAEEGMSQLLQFFEQYDNIILSDERIWNGGLSEDRNCWKRLQERIINKGVTIKVIVYLRRQDDYLFSWWNQHVKINRRDQAALSFTEVLETLPVIQLDYYTVLEQISAYVGKENIIVRIFDKKEFLKHSSDGSILADFLETLHLEYTDEYTIADPVKNPGLTKNNVEIKRLLNTLPNSYEMGQPLFYKILVEQSENNTTDKKTSMFSKEEHEQFLATYREGNAKIAKEYLGLNDLFEYSYHAEEKWNRNNDEFPADIIKFFGSTTLQLLQEIRKLEQRVQTQEHHINNLRYKLKHPAQAVFHKLYQHKESTKK